MKAEIILALSPVVRPSAVVNRTSYLGSLPRTVLRMLLSPRPCQDG